ncbi:MAG: hypothetical protein ABEL51_10715 [Salinibacter sp.]
MRTARFSRLATLLGLFFLLGACSASKNITKTQTQLRKIPDYRDAEMSTFSKNLNKYRKKQEDKVLYHLEYGMLHHYQGNWKQSAEHFKKSERAIDKFYTESINRNLQSMLVNDLQLAYEGEAYEDIYLNVFKSFNYLHMGNQEGAMVEARRVTHELEKLSDRYKGLAESVSRDTAQSALKQVDKKLEDVDLLNKEDKDKPLEIQQHSAMGRFLTTVLYAKNKSPDDARIEFRKLRTALEDQGRTGFLSSFPKNVPEATSADVVVPARSQLTEPDAYNTLLVAFNGDAPRKQERRFQFDLVIDEEEVELSFAVPVLKLPETEVARVRARVAGEFLEVPVVENMQETAKAMFKEKKPIIYTRAVIRSFLKAGATEAGEKAVSDEYGENAGWLAGEIGELLSSAAAQADTRAWQTMPGLARATVVKLPAGTHTITFEFLSAEGQLLKKRTRRVEVNGPQDLALAESIYLE